MHTVQFHELQRVNKVSVPRPQWIIYGSVGGRITVPYPRGVGLLGSLALANDILVQHIRIASYYEMMVEDIQP